MKDVSYATMVEIRAVAAGIVAAGFDTICEAVLDRINRRRDRE